MKKNYSFLLVVAIIAGLMLASCSAGTAEETTSEEVKSGMENQVYECLGTAEDALVDLDCREITIAVENAYLPFNYISAETGEAGGWDYEVWPAICELLHCKPVFVESAWEVMIQSVEDGLVDTAGDGVTILPERLEQVDFSDGYVNVEQRLLVRKGEDRFTSIEDIVANTDLMLGTQAQTSNYETAKKYLPEDRIQAFEQFPFAVQALIAGDIDAVLIDEVAGLGYMGTNAESLELIGPSISSDQLAFPFQKGSDLIEPVNMAIQALKDNGFLNEINLKYFGPDFTITYDDIQ
ncbi:MAG: ABC transporter substrate-binding protein [Anaerolineaceae bacterium]|jgi:polar amino acid transport system substrate-binding protein|nr:MAG: ABC transporter substrate-binding protein [Anaerolineaceae bacterium]